MAFQRLNIASRCTETENQPEGNEFVVLISAQFCFFAI